MTGIKSTVGLALGLVSALARPGWATEADSLLIFTVDPVIVTAQRLEERTQDVPISVSVYEGEELTRSLVSTLDDLTLQTPNVNIIQSRSSSSTATMFMRGIGQENQSPKYHCAQSCVVGTRQRVGCVPNKTRSRYSGAGRVARRVYRDLPPTRPS